jgi:glycosyltransferase involved in cell wall biosynthesis
MRLLFVAPRFLPEIGGVEKHVNYVARELLERGIDVKIITSTHREDLPSNDKQGKAQVTRFIHITHDQHRSSSLFNLINAWFVLLKKYKLLISNDAIHLHDTQTFMWIFPFIFLLKKPIFITFHGFDDYPIPKSAQLVRKIAEKVVDGNICVGAFLAKWYTTRPDFTTIGGVEAPQLPSNPPIEKAALFIGRLTKDTGILEFIQALTILKQEFGIDLPLHICGDGPLKPKIIENARQYNLEIFMHGLSKNPEDYLTMCSYAFVSGYLSILEAMSCKRPVFAIYNNPLKKDYLYSIPDANNLMVITASPKALAEKLEVVVRHPQRINPILEKAYSFASEQTWKKVANVYLELYQRKGGLKSSTEYP